MAPTFPRQILCTFLYPLTRPPHCVRIVAQTARRQNSKGAAMPMPRAMPQKSLRVAVKEAAKGNQTFNDMGLLDGTFIMPTGVNKPSFFSLPRERLKLELHRLITRFKDFGAILYYKFGIGKKPNRPRLKLRNTGRIAAALHLQMYNAFADGDLHTLQRLCTDGLLEKFRSRIAKRPMGERLQWTLHKQVRTPRVVSHRAVVLPMVEGAALRQAVVRLESRQSLARMRQDGSVVEGTGEEKVIREYLVVQRRMWHRLEEPWMVWGTVEETDWKGVVFK
ncbi:hypothetical protein MMC14_003938 [Varicellaria rhodocarpa]|nr:hypothetical protein [Varicellaria rhodocarpa]